MIHPSTDDLLDKVDSRYTLVIMAAKRARKLRESQVNRDEAHIFKEVSAALEDIAAGKITYERTKNGIK